MKIDKSVGKWEDNTTLFEDVAYSLYIQFLTKYYIEQKFKIPNRIYPDQFLFLNTIYNKRDKVLKKFGIQAKNIIRKEKLNKLNEYK